MDVQKIISPPRLRKNTNIERKATWTELFYDLAFVVAIAVVGHELSAHLDAKGIATFVVIFGLLWWAWIGATFYNDRFDTDDLIHRLLTLVQMVGISLLAIFSHDVLGDNFTRFIFSYFIVQGVILFSNARAGYYNKGSRGTMVWYVTGGVIALIPVLFALTQGDPTTRILLLYATLAIHLLVPVITPDSHTQVSTLNIGHLAERFGLFTILILGESIASVVSAGSESFVGTTSFLTIVLGVGLAFLFWWLYFENLDGNAIKKGKRTGIIWVYTHLPLMMGLVFLALGIQRVISGVPEVLNGDLFSGAVLINLAWAFVFFCFSIIEFVTTYRGQKQWYELSQGSALLVCSAASVILVFFGIHQKPLLNMSILALMGVLMLLVDIGFKFRCQSCLNKEKK